MSLYLSRGDIGIDQGASPSGVSMRVIPTAYWTIIGGIKNLSPAPETTAEFLAKMPIQEVTLSKSITASQKEGQDLAEMAEKIRNLAEENTRALAAIRLRSLLDQSEAMAAWCLELPEFASVYDMGDGWGTGTQGATGTGVSLGYSPTGIAFENPQGGNITAHGDYISEECYSEAIRDYFEDVEDSGDEEEGFTTLLRFVVAGRRF
ncbi:hypothetical protein BD779DRAFT_1773240 [Infundibulicybe gibba]|nr:hypothetical protein BD779DRAFT_1773240 [Infundibulicybe gibba]